MRIKRFNENQQYLTDPFDPEMETSMKVNFNEFRKSMFNQVLNICKRLGLEGIDGGQQVSVYKDTHYDNYNSLCNFYDNKMEDVEKELKEYFKV
jgi:repressor of nif and glnA expression